MLVGDSDVDVKTARNAGAWACGVTYGFGAETLKEFPPDVLLDNLAALPPYLEEPIEDAP
jgi:phosphoglycolate phosphatase